MKKIIERLKKSGNKLTKARKEVLYCLENAKRPLSAREIHGLLEDVDLASVYRNLKLFKDLELVQAESGEKYEKYCLNSRPHHHIVCTGCDYMESVECDHDFTHNNFTDIKHQLRLTGLCRKCSAK